MQQQHQHLFLQQLLRQLPQQEYTQQHFQQLSSNQQRYEHLPASLPSSVTL